ncbi:DUF2946 domain-containing protein [Thalassotalea insulae]|uniref:DUF2946 domain-containing protein n=1 Tax=Thalassotalea insulae TaxID=2056778 RepID=UPI0024E14959|nr:DUF2946 domain-containing protein [Thalassotalea insulae]
MTIVIVLQSFTVVSVAKQSHQIDAQHMQTEHSHQLDKLMAQASSDRIHDVQDCHHCGHCHGAHIQWVLSKSDVVSANGLASNSFLYRSVSNKEFIEELIRPPIA